MFVPRVSVCVFHGVCVCVCPLSLTHSVTSGRTEVKKFLSDCSQARAVIMCTLAEQVISLLVFFHPQHSYHAHDFETGK